MSDFIYRRLRLHEFFQYQNLIDELSLQEEDVLPDSNLNSVFKLLCSLERMFFAILAGDKAYVVKSKSVVGAAHMHYIFDDSWCLTAIIVDSTCRGKGVGKKFMDHIMKDLKKQGARNFYVLTYDYVKGAIKFYKKYGLKEDIVAHTMKAKTIKSKKSYLTVSYKKFLRDARPKPNELGILYYPNPDNYLFRRLFYSAKIIKVEKNGISAYALVEIPRNSDPAFVHFIHLEKDSLIDALLSAINSSLGSKEEYYIRLNEKQKKILPKKYKIKDVATMVSFNKKL